MQLSQRIKFEAPIFFKQCILQQKKKIAIYKLHNFRISIIQWWNCQMGDQIILKR
jgi:hypothetical protein